MTSSPLPPISPSNLSSSSLASVSQITPYNPADYIQTANTLNRVSRKAVILGTANIVLGGKCIIHHAAFIRGDLTRSSATPGAATTDQPAPEKRPAAGSNVVIVTGRYCAIGEGTMVRPPYKTYKGAFSYYPLKMDSFVAIGADTVFQASTVGSHVSIGRNCVVGRFVTIKDCAVILDNTVIPPYTTIPSGQIWGGDPARYIGDLQESWSEEWENRCREYYLRFRPAS